MGVVRLLTAATAATAAAIILRMLSNGRTEIIYLQPGYKYQ